MVAVIVGQCRAFYTSRMSVTAESIHHEHQATVKAVRYARARALHLGTLLLEVRQELGAGEWERWLAQECPIPASAAKRYAEVAEHLKQAA